MKGYHVNIEQETVQNTLYRKVLYTAKSSQLVLMCVRPNEELGVEIHQENDQFFRFEEGTGMCTIDGNEYAVTDGTAIVVPKGSEHNIVNTSATQDLKFYTIYSPPHHKDGTIHATKADEIEQEFDGTTTEQ